MSIINSKEDSIDISNPEAILNIIKLSELSSDPVNKTMNAVEKNTKKSFISCSFCKHLVLDEFLTCHIGMHIKNRFEEESNVRVSDTVARSISRQDSSYLSKVYQLPQHSPPPKEDFSEVKHEDVKEFIYSMPVSQIKDIDTFSYRKIKDVSILASSSKNGKYSDFTMNVWYESSSSISNNGWAGSKHSYVSKSAERVQIHLTYDNVEEYYTISGRVIKRSEYSEYESEEGAVPDRLCNQNEIMAEVKNILLFFRISPRSAYKFFKKIMNGEFKITEESSPMKTCSNNHFLILEDLKKNKPTNYHGYKDDEDWPSVYGV